jgi:hypothetical protein
MKVRHWQEQLTLTFKPPASRVVTALRTDAMPAGVQEQMLAMAVGAFGDMTAERSCAAAGKRVDGTNVTGQYSIAVPLQVVLAVPTQNIGNPEHGSVCDYKLAIS